VLIQRMVDDLCFSVGIVPAPTGREDDGLAMSSRNQYLTEAERSTAPTLYRELTRVAESVSSGHATREDACSTANAALESVGFRPDYVEIRRASDLAKPGENDTELVVLAAAWLGKARLIDNVRFSRCSE
jgi:pantoate--beta-alanine ligase